MPELGTLLVPELGTLLVPELGTPLVPELGTPLVPELGTLLVPELGTLLVPELGTPLVKGKAEASGKDHCHIETSHKQSFLSSQLHCLRVRIRLETVVNHMEYQTILLLRLLHR